jgi:transposase
MLRDMLLLTLATPLPFVTLTAGLQDSLDAVSLVGLLVRYGEGETNVWSTVSVPDPADEDQRHLHRELDQLRRERTDHTNRVGGLLAAIGIKVNGKCVVPEVLDTLRQWNGEPVPEGLKRRLLHELERMDLLARQIKTLEIEQAEPIRDDQTLHVEEGRKLMGIKGVGPTSATILVYEFFGWRQFANRREVGALAGLTPTPYQSGESNHEQGISKAGNVRVRWIMTDLAWSWLCFQPKSPLSQWYHKRFGSGTSRMRRTGIMALARKLLIALWRYVERCEGHAFQHRRFPDRQFVSGALTHYCEASWITARRAASAVFSSQSRS